MSIGTSATIDTDRIVVPMPLWCKTSSLLDQVIAFYNYYLYSLSNKRVTDEGYDGDTNGLVSIGQPSRLRYFYEENYQFQQLYFEWQTERKRRKRNAPEGTELKLVPF